MTLKKGKQQVDNIAPLKKIKPKEIHQWQNEFLEKFLIAAFCLITVPAWDKFFKHLFQEIFGSFNTLSSELLYALLLTFIAFSIGVIFLIFITTTSRKARK